MERAYGAIFYSSGAFETREDYLTFVANQDVADATLAFAREYSEVVRELYDETMDAETQAILPTVQRMRTVIRNHENEEVEGSWEKANDWFGNMTFYLDSILGVSKT